MAWRLLRARTLAHVRMLARMCACWRAGVLAHVLVYLLQCIVIRCHPMSSDVIRCHTQSLEIVSMLMNLYNCIQSDPI
jgi:hypothetical protein